MVVLTVLALTNPSIMFVLEQWNASDRTMKMRTANHNSVSTHSTKCHHIKMCARKIKANELLVTASPSSPLPSSSSSSFSLAVADTECIWFPYTRQSCVHFTFPQDVWPLIVLVGSVFVTAPLKLLSTSLTSNHFFIFIWLKRAYRFPTFLLYFNAFHLRHFRHIRYPYCNNVASHLCSRNAKYNNNDYNLFEELLDELETKTNARKSE